MLRVVAMILKFILRLRDLDDLCFKGKIFITALNFGIVCTAVSQCERSML